MGTIKKQGIRNAVITYIGVVIGFVSLMFIQPNLLKPEELGLTRILIAAATLVATVLPLGVSSVTTKFFPFFRNVENKHHGYFGFMLLFPLIGTLFCAAFIYIFKSSIIGLYLQQSPLFIQYFNLLLPFACIMGLNLTLNAYSSSLYKTTIISFFESIVTRILFIGLIVLYYFHWIDMDQFIYLFVFIYLLQSISMIIYLFAIDKPSFKIDSLHLKSIGIGKIVIFGILLTLTNLSSISLKHLDVLMLGKYYNLEYVGVFAVAAYISLVIEIPLSSLEKITNAKVSQAWANNDTQSIKQIYEQSVKYLMLIGGVLLIGIVINIHELLGLLPETYHRGATVAIIACVGSFMNIATGVNSSILFTSTKYRYGAYLLVLLLVLTFSLNMLLIPKYGMEGSALATAISAAIYNLLKFILIWKHFGMQPYDFSSIKILFVIAVVGSLAFFIPPIASPIVSILIKSTVIASLYMGMIYGFRIVPEFHKYIPFSKKA